MPKQADDPRSDKDLATRPFAITTEPKGGRASKGLPRFVIQQHDATRR